MNADELIERMERETGTLVEEGSPAMLGLVGAMARVMGKTPPSYTERDDVAAGTLIVHKKDDAAAKLLLASLGIDLPDDPAS